jgi:hypothetical protein
MLPLDRMPALLQAVVEIRETVLGGQGGTAP